MTPTAIDSATFAELQANAGADFVAELVGTFAEEAPRLIDEMRSALAAAAAERFRRAAHSLKSNSNTFGATALAEAARTLELGGLPGPAAGTAALAALDAEYARTIVALQRMAAGGAGGG
jgi:HPt (histidine-containing phosphotransfer) domain-containing protein